jgi:hypothetical protein
MDHYISKQGAKTLPKEWTLNCISFDILVCIVEKLAEILY